MSTHKVRRYFVVYDTLEVEAESPDAACAAAMVEPCTKVTGAEDAEEWSGFNVETEGGSNWYDRNGEPL